MSNKISRHKLSLILFLIALLSSSLLRAHEFWLEPVHYRVSLGDEMAVNIKVGQNFKGEMQIYNPSDFIKFQISRAVEGKEQLQAIKSRLGDMPAFKKKSEAVGLKLISYVSNANLLTYQTADIFVNFLKKEGLEWVLEAHKKRKLPASGFKEVFHRYAKTLLAVGKGNGTDRILGFPLEWVLESNPYTEKGILKARLYWNKKPFSNAVATLFIKQENTVSRQSLTTDGQGVVIIPTDHQGTYLLNAVQMIEASDDTERDTAAAWESLWASTTFEITGN